MARSVATRSFFSVLILAVGVFTVASLATFDKNDLSTYCLPPHSPARNAGGVIGARVADFLWQGMGIGSGLLVALGGAWSILNLVGRGSEKIVLRAAGGVVLVACACTFANWMGPAANGLPSSGGTVGLVLGDLLQHYFGRLGQWFLSGCVALIALMMLSVDELLLPPIAHLVGVAAGGVGSLWRTKSRPRRTSPARRSAVSALLEVPAEEDADSDEREPEPKAPSAVPAARPADTGRPVTVGYLNRLQQPGAPTTVDVEGKVADDTDDRDMAEALAIASTRRRAAAERQPYKLPSLDLLDKAKPVDHAQRAEHIQEQIDVLERTLREFGVGATVVDIEQGPVVTRFELTLQAGTKLSKVTSLSDDLAIATKAPAVRIVAPIPGKSTVGIELPNMNTEIVRLRELLESEAAQRPRNITLFLGKDASGQPIICDLTRMPHLLIAGATGSGKSVCINAVITSVLCTLHPDDVRLILIDPKVVELAHYADIPHLLTPVVTDMKRAAWILDWACKQMDERYDILARVGVRSISAFNRLGEEEIRCRLGEDADDPDFPLHMPYIVIIVDELADMMMLASKNIEGSITRLAQKSRAVGLHLIVATQRPSVDVITGLIKSNLPTRISFQVTSKVDSRTILDRNGAEKLLGCGDMLFLAPGVGDLIRAQGTYVSDDEVQRVVQFIKAQRAPDFTLEPGRVTDDGRSLGPDDEDGNGYSSDELYEPACRVVLATRRGSVSLLQRKLEIGYTRAARLIDMMAEEGIVGDYKGAKAREVVMGLEEWEARHGKPSGPMPAITDADLDEDLLEESRALEKDA